MTDLAARLIGDVKGAGVGLWRLMKLDPAWAAGFDASAGGFVRSFAGPLLSLPFYLLAVDLVARKAVGGDRLLWSAALELTADAVAYPAAMAVVARAFGIGEGYGGFIVVVNWSQLFINLILAGASTLALAGDNGLAAFGFVSLLLLLASIYIVWRAARETLSTEIAPALLSVVLSVAISAGASRLAGLVAG